MKTKQTYSVEFREQALAKVLQRGNRSVETVASELNMNVLTLRKWIRVSNAANRNPGPVDARRPEDWSLEERLLALQQSHGLSDEALNAWCRERGLFAHHLDQWRAQFCSAGTASSARANAPELRELKQANAQLQRELKRKEKALAEAAALLVLFKKVSGAVRGRGRMSSPEERATLRELVDEATTAGARQARACAVLGLSARTVQRWQGGGPEAVDGRTLRHHDAVHKLSIEERAELLAVANSVEFGHLPPSQIVPRLADQGRYIASESTFYRVLREENQLAHRRSERPARARSKPRAVCADGPNQLFSWDITYLPTTVRGQYFYLYLFMDVFSRMVVGWQVYAEECSAQASELLKDLCAREAIKPGQVILHSDNGGPMKGATMLATLQALGVMPSLSRPGVSNDNPFSESLFKTLKYRPAYPLQAFDTLFAARAWVTGLVRWYNHEHRHSAIRFVTPAQRHANLDQQILDCRATLYEAARQRNPLRWKGPTRNWKRVHTVHLNPDQTDNSELIQRPHQQEQKAA
ncbi:IS3 family transposase [Paraburkholderia sp. SIMBA_049]